MNLSSKMAEAVVNGATALYDRISGPTVDREYEEYSQSRSSGRYRGGAGHGLTEEEILDRDLQRESHNLAKLSSSIGQEKHEIRSTQREIHSLQSRNQETQKEIETVNQDLTATRAHDPDEGTMQKGELINEFVAVLNLLDNLMNDFQTWYSRFLAKGLSERRAVRIREHFRGNERMRGPDKLVELTVDQSAKTIADLLLRHYLCSALIHYVFQPLLPGKPLDSFYAGVISDTLYKVQVEESQDRGGRWRALMYKQALIQEPRDTTWCADIATGFAQEAFYLMGLVTDAEVPDDLFQSALTSTTRIFDAAALFKDRAMKFCVEVDFEVYIPENNRKLERWLMEEAYKSRISSRSVILGVGLGLELSCNVQRGSKYVRGYEHPILASVVGEKSTLIPQSWY